MSWGEISEEEIKNEISRDVSMIESNYSIFSIALDKCIFDVDLNSKVRAEMLDPSYMINSIFSIQFTYLTIGSVKKPFFWMAGDNGFTGILVNEVLPLQLEWMKEQLTHVEINVDVLLRNFYYFHGTKLGILKQGFFVPYLPLQ